MRKNFQNGVATVLTIFILSMLGVLVGVSLVKTGYFESIMGRSVNDSAKAYFGANSGIENAVREIAYKPSEFGNPGPDYINFNLDGVEVKTTVTGDENQKTLVSVGTYESGNTKYSRKITAEVINTSISPDFSEAVFGGFGGVFLDNNTVISNLDSSEDGNVYSRSFIKGRKNDSTGTTCKNSASAVYGNATAVGEIEKWDNSDKGVCITKNAFAKYLNNCFIAGDSESESITSDCETIGVHTTGTAPEDKEMPNIGVDAIISYLASKPKFEGDCEIGGSADKDCTNGTNVLGTITINGDLIVDQNKSLTLKGPVLVNGNIDIRSNSSIDLADNTTSRIVISRGKISSASNVSYSSYDDAFIILVSTDDSDGISCESGKAAVEVSSNDESVLFEATKGCILIRANQTFRGALYGEVIELGVGSRVLYNSKLNDLVINISEDGGWQLVSFKEN